VRPLFLSIGGLFVDCGLFGSGGGGGFAFLPIVASYEGGGESGCSSFIAAIRARIDIGGVGASSLMMVSNRYYIRRRIEEDIKRFSKKRPGPTREARK